MKNTLLVLVPLMLALTGCIALPTIETETPAQVQAGSRVSRDDFRKQLIVDSQKATYNNVKILSLSSGGVDEGVYWLTFIKSEISQAKGYSLRLKTTRGTAQGWAFWGEAFDQNGARLPVEKLASEVGQGGITYELVEVKLTREYLETSASSGVKIRVDGKRASQIINLPPAYILGFLAKVDAADGVQQ